MDPIVAALLLIVLVTGAIGVYSEMRRRRSERLVREFEEARSPNRLRERLAEHASGWRGYVASVPENEAAGPTWTNADDFVLAGVIADLDLLGFFSHLGSKPLEEKVRELGQAYQDRYGEPFAVDNEFRDPKLAALDSSRVWWRDTEADVAEGNEVYRQTLQEWASISRGEFTPENIRETWVGLSGPIEVTFDHRGVAQVLAPIYNHDWLDMDALLRVSGCLSDSEFVTVHTGDQTAYVLCATADEADQLRKHSWPVRGSS